MHVSTRFGNGSRLRAAFVVALTFAAALGGCGGGDTPAVAASGAACKLVTLTEAVDAVGGGNDLKLANDAEDGCTYATDDGLKSVDVKVEAMQYDPTQVDQIKGMLEPEATTDLSGLGDTAFAYQPTENVTQVYVWGKGRFLEVLVGNASGKTSDAAKKLTETAYSRL